MPDSPSRRFGMIPAAIVEDPTFADLPATAAKVLMVLTVHANGKTRQCWPSRRRISECSGLCERSVTAALYSLEECGMLTVDRRHGCRNRYTLHDVVTGRLGTTSGPTLTSAASCTSAPPCTTTSASPCTSLVQERALQEQKQEQTKQQQAVVVVADADGEKTESGNTAILDALGNRGIFGPKAEAIGAHPRATPELVERIAATISGGATNPAGVLITALEARLDSGDRGIAAGCVDGYVSTPESRARLAAQEAAQDAQDATERDKRLGSAGRRDECLAGLTDAQVDDYRQQVLRGIDERKRGHYVNITVDQIRTSPRTTQALYLAGTIARIHGCNNTPAKGTT